jgi:transcriptional regulator with XRE-family HTH domain
MNFAKRLKQLRVAAGLTQEALARKSGLGLGSVRDWEQGKREPLLSSAFALAEALGNAVDDFADATDAGDEVKVVTPKAGKPAAAGKPGKKGRGKT